MAVGCKIYKMMKRIFNILTAALLFIGFATSCEKAPKIEEGIVGEWQLTEMDANDAAGLSTSVYIEFRADKSFDMYQKVGDVMRYRKYVGTYSVSGAIISGVYSDGKKWGSSYRAALEADAQVLVLTAVTLDGDGAVQEEGEVSKYVKATLSQEEKDAADVMTKSTESFVPFL